MSNKSFRPYNYGHHSKSTKSLGKEFESNKMRLDVELNKLNILNNTLAGKNPPKTISKSDFEKQYAQIVQNIKGLTDQQQKIIEKQQKMIEEKTKSYHSVYRDSNSPIRQSKHNKRVTFVNAKKGGIRKSRKSRKL